MVSRKVFIVPHEEGEQRRRVDRAPAAKVDIDAIAASLAEESGYVPETILTVPTKTVSSRVPPNGGLFSWYVVFTSFLLTFLLTGFAKSTGKFRPHVQEEFPATSKLELGWVFGLAPSISLMFSPVTSVLSRWFGYKLLVMNGLLLCAASSVMLCNTVSVLQLILVHGFCFGIGSSIINTSAIACTGQYFTTRKPLALTIALSGGLVGTFVFPLIVDVLLTEFGTGRTMHIVAAMFLAVTNLAFVAYGSPERHFRTVTEEVPLEATSEVVATEVGAPEVSIRKVARSILDVLTLSYLGKSQFIAFVIIMALVQGAGSSFKAVLSEKAKALGGDSGHNAYIGGSAEVFARVVYTVLSTRYPRCHAFEMRTFLWLGGASLVFLTVTKVYWLYVIFVFVAWAAASMTPIFMALVMGQLFRSVKPLGLVRFFMGVSLLASKFITDRATEEIVVDPTGVNDTVWNCLGGNGLLLLLASLMLYFLGQCRKK